MNTEASIGIRNQGPLPVGQYTIDASALRRQGFLKAFINAFRPSVGDYGSFYVPLVPYPGTDALTRDGFYLHGGAFPGSAGCIDAGGGFGGDSSTERLINDLLNDSDTQSQLIVY
jgi:hypothetical protein